jgi:hypothetical protein
MIGSVQARLDLSAKTAEELDLLVGQTTGLDVQIAQHPNVDGATLAILAASPSRVIKRAVMLNPLCPTGVLMDLASKFPLELFNNPVLPLLLLEDPDLFSRLPISAVKAILKSPDCPEIMISWALKHGGGSHALALADRVEIPVKALKQIAQGPHIKASERAQSRLMGMGIALGKDER